MTDRIAFVISDRTGITAETLGHSLLCHFPAIHFEMVTLPFIDTAEKALDAVRKINDAATRSGWPPVIFATLADDKIRETISHSNGVLFDLFDTFLAPLERELGMASEHSVGSSHGVRDAQEYTGRISALNYSMRADDGGDPSHYDQSNLIIVGVSRTGKTPTSLYLALHFGIYTANYPLTPDELDTGRLPANVSRHRKKLFGLTIDPERLAQVRAERYNHGRYAQLKQCQYEVKQAEALFRRERIPFVNTTQMSIEEIATTILLKANLKRYLM